MTSHVTDDDIRLIQELQKGITVCERPYADLAERACLTEEQVLARIREWRANGVIRRIGIMLNHYRAGFSANGMCVWDVPEDRVEEIGSRLAAYEVVTHCYARPVSDAWPYRLYTMIHCPSREELQRTVSEIAEKEGLSNYRILTTKRELKKTATRLFSE